MLAESPDAVRTVRAIGNTIVVRPILDAETTTGGLYKPKTARARSHLMMGEVVSAGVGHYTSKGALLPIDLEPGDFVLFKRTYGEIIWGDAQETIEYRVLDRPDVVCHVTNPELVDVGMDVETSQSDGDPENWDDMLDEQLDGMMRDARDSGREEATKTISHKRPKGAR